jgi:hypothetical protein
MAKVWNDFLPLLLPHVPSCPDITLKTYLGIVSSDFFARTYLWRDNIDAIYLAPNQIEYDLDAEAVVEDVISVVYDETVLDRTDIRFIPAERATETGDPKAYWVQADRSIRVFPVPEAAGKMTVTAVLKPSRTASGVEDWIYETFADVLVSGTVAQVAMIPGKDWTSPDLAMMHKGLYERAITQARIRDMRGVEMGVRMRPAA